MLKLEEQAQLDLHEQAFIAWTTLRESPSATMSWKLTDIRRKIESQMHTIFFCNIEIGKSKTFQVAAAKINPSTSLTSVLILY